MPSRSRASSSRALVGLSALVTIGVLALGTTAIIAAPASHPAANGTTRYVSTPARDGDKTLRLLSWSGRFWAIYPNGQRGPEDVPMTNASRAVYVDSRGWLHLKIVKIRGVWRSVELQSVDPVTYGTYQLINDTATANFAPTTVLGMFVYRPHALKYTNEIDIENSRFPNLLKAPNNAQFAIQPYYTKGNEYPYSVAPSYKPLLQQFTWLPAAPGPDTSNRTVQFVTRVGSTPQAPLLARWTYHGYSVPDPQTSQGGPVYLYLNLWLNKGQAPIGGTHSAVLRSLTYTPLGG